MTAYQRHQGTYATYIAEPICWLCGDKEADSQHPPMCRLCAFHARQRLKEFLQESKAEARAKAGKHPDYASDTMQRNPVR